MWRNKENRKITCSHDAVQLLMLPPVRHHLEKFVSILNFNLQNAICLRPFADACVLLLFVVLQHVLQCYIARLMNMHRICTPALPCSCLCSSSRTSDNGNDCCSSGLRLRQQTKNKLTRKHVFSLLTWGDELGKEEVVFSTHTWEI